MKVCQSIQIDVAAYFKKMFGEKNTDMGLMIEA